MVERYTRQTYEKLSALGETLGVEGIKFGETLTGNADGNPEPSPRQREGVETLWFPP